MQVAVVETESSTHGPFLEMAGDRGKGTDIKQAVGRDEEFLTEVLGVLPHTGDACCPLPQLFRCCIMDIVIDGMQAEIET